MNEPSATDRAAYAAVDEALRTAPLGAVPPALVPAVMARVRGLVAAPRFRLVWLDYALSLFAAGLAGLLLLLWQAVPAWLAPRLQLEVLHWSYYTPPAALWGALVSGLGLAAVAVVTVGILLVRPRFTR
jgi:hypothetical protein